MALADTGNVPAALSSSLFTTCGSKQSKPLTHRKKEKRPFETPKEKRLKWYQLPIPYFGPLEPGWDASSVLAAFLEWILLMGCWRNFLEHGSTVWLPAFLFTECQGTQSGSHAASNQGSYQGSTPPHTCPWEQDLLIGFLPLLHSSRMLSEGG